jgi:hypothetical protein
LSGPLRGDSGGSWAGPTLELATALAQLSERLARLAERLRDRAASGGQATK